VDALLWAAEQPPPPEAAGLLRQLGIGEVQQQRVLGPSAPPLSVSSSPRLILVTAHRRESFGPPLQRICTALRELVRRRDDVQIVYPVHLNPNVWEPVHELLEGVPRIRLLPPADYLTLVHLMKRSYLLLTDSGGIQEEAPTLDVPVLVLREVTERPEAVSAGAAKLVGTKTEEILEEASLLLEEPGAHAAMARAVNPYGDGHAAVRIVAALLQAAGGT
jgi:UDP-N-acetylglucosamine 2-epimerase (non-hydrolysing)